MCIVRAAAVAACLYRVAEGGRYILIFYKHLDLVSSCRVNGKLLPLRHAPSHSSYLLDDVMDAPLGARGLHDRLIGLRNQHLVGRGVHRNPRLRDQLLELLG